MKTIVLVAIFALVFALIGYLAVFFGLNKLYFTYLHDVSALAYALVCGVVGAFLGALIAYLGNTP